MLEYVYNRAAGAQPGLGTQPRYEAPGELGSKM